MSHRGRAVVIGASMAGLVTARVLADYYDEVVILDKDVFEPRPAHRRFVPQSRHAHGLLSPGASALMRLFPGWEDDIDAGGGTAGQRGWPGLDREMKIYVVRGASVVKLPAWWMTGVLASRPLIEFTVRHRVLALPNVTLRAQVTVKGLRTGTGQRAVTGVTTAEGQLEADLVVDASGRGSRLPVWLAGLGYPAPPASVIHSDVRYGSCVVELDAGFCPEYLVVLGAQAAGMQSAGGVFTRIENGMMQCTLATVGSGDGGPPRDTEGYRRFAAALSCPAFAETLHNSTMVTPIVPYHVKTNRLLHYERLARRPAGIVAVGDAVCAFNPAYGQGMSVAAQSALALGEVLAADGGTPGPGFEQRAARAVASVTRRAWALATAEDMRLGCRAEGIPARRGSRAAHWYQERFERAAMTDPEAALALSEVINLQRPPGSLACPRLAWRTLRPRPRPAPVPLTSAGGADRSTSLLTVRTGHVMLDQVSLHYGEAGGQGQETVLFLHGWPDLWFGWEPLMRTLAGAGYHAIAPDQRGYGRSGKPPRVADYRMELLAGDIEQLIGRLGTGPVHLVGHDWGGSVAWALAMQRPSLLRSLTIINAPHPAVLLADLASRPGQLLRSWYILLLQVPGLAESLLGMHDAAPQATLLRKGARLDAAMLRRYREQWRNPGAIRAPLYWYRALARDLLHPRDQRRHYDQPVSVPVQIIWGQNDPVFRPGSARASAARSGAALHLLDTGHWPHNEAAPAVTRLLLDWLAGHQQAPLRPVAGAAAP